LASNKKRGKRWGRDRSKNRPRSPKSAWQTTRPQPWKGAKEENPVALNNGGGSETHRSQNTGTETRKNLKRATVKNESFQGKNEKKKKPLVGKTHKREVGRGKKAGPRTSAWLGREEGPEVFSQWGLDGGGKTVQTLHFFGPKPKRARPEQGQETKTPPKRQGASWRKKKRRHGK